MLKRLREKPRLAAGGQRSLPRPSYLIRAFEFTVAVYPSGQMRMTVDPNGARSEILHRLRRAAQLATRMLTRGETSGAILRLQYEPAEVAKAVVDNARHFIRKCLAPLSRLADRPPRRHGRAPGSPPTPGTVVHDPGGHA
jgi:hypothetical protein